MKLHRIGRMFCNDATLGTQARIYVGVPPGIIKHRVHVRPSLFDSEMYAVRANDGDAHVLVDRPK
jgi:hypothetical protein